MANHKEILRLKNLGLSNKEIAEACGCGRNTVTRTLQRAQEASVSWEQLRALPPEKVTEKLFPESTVKVGGRATAARDFIPASGKYHPRDTANRPP